MTLEELQAEVARLSGELDTVNANNNKLVKEKREALTRAEKAEADATDAAETARAETGTELDKANRRISKLEKELGEAVTRADKSDKGLRDYKASAALSNAIASANVDADDVAMLTKAFRADIEFDDSGEPTIEGKPIDAYAKSYFAGAGKKYVRVADHNGGGASGSGNSEPVKISKVPETDAEWRAFNALDDVERNATADRLGVPQLKI